MIINDFINKIKDKLRIDTFTIMCLLVIIGVGIASFGLGRLSAIHNSSLKEDDQIKIIDMNNELVPTSNNNLNSLNTNTVGDITKEKRYVASKNGKLYYSVGCSGAKRISENNMIWFSTSEEAKKSGYEFSSSCKL